MGVVFTLTASAHLLLVVDHPDVGQSGVVILFVSALKGWSVSVFAAFTVFTLFRCVLAILREAFPSVDQSVR